MQLPLPSPIRLGPEVRPYIWLKRLGVRLRLQPKGCTHKGYLREVWCVAPESLRAKLDLGLSRSCPVHDCTRIEGPWLSRLNGDGGD